MKREGRLTLLSSATEAILSDASTTGMLGGWDRRVRHWPTHMKSKSSFTEGGLCVCVKSVLCSSLPF